MKTQSFTELYTQHHPRLVSAMTAMMRNREDGEDVVTAALATAFEKYHLYRGESSLSTWVHAIAFHQACNDLKRRKKMPLVDIDELQEFLVLPDRSDDRLARGVHCERLRRSLAKLPAMYRDVLVKHFIDDQSMKEISRDLDIPFGTVLSRTHKAKALLRRAWEVSQ